MTFPDPNVTTEYDSPEGIKYVWNGFAWEIKCGGGGGVVVMPPYTIDAEDDTHWGDHRLEEVGYPVAANDAATKGYVDATKEFLQQEIIELEEEIDASSFLLKSGDTMEGKLQLDKPVGDNYNGDGFIIKGAIADSYSSTSGMVQNANLLQVNHIARNPDQINYFGSIKTPKNITTKEYVDDKIKVLLAKIEELEMTGGTTENYQLQMYNKTLGGSGAVGPQMNANEIMSCENDGNNWSGNRTHYLASEYRHIYVCFEDGYQLNSTGQMSVMESSGSERYTREGNIATFNVTRVEVCPPDKSSGKNIYRAAIQLDAIKFDNSQVFCNWKNGFVYITFSGGSLTKTSH